jgi:hypothetical protein
MCAYKLNKVRYENLYAYIVAVMRVHRSKMTIHCFYLHFKNISLICELLNNFVILNRSGRVAIIRTATTTTRVKEKKRERNIQS